MNITLHSTLGLKETIDGKDIEMLAPDGTTVRGFLVRIVERWGDRLSPICLSQEEITPYIWLMVNGQTMRSSAVWRRFTKMEMKSCSQFCCRRGKRDAAKN